MCAVPSWAPGQAAQDPAEYAREEDSGSPRQRHAADSGQLLPLGKSAELGGGRRGPGAGAPTSPLTAVSLRAQGACPGAFSQCPAHHPHSLGTFPLIQERVTSSLARGLRAPVSTQQRWGLLSPCSQL